MRRKTSKRLIHILFAVILCISTLSVSAFAAEDCYASDESGNAEIPSSIDTLTISKVDVDIPNTGENSFELTPEGNLSLIDDLLQSGGYITSSKEDEEIKSKQFLTVTSKNGNTFYIVIDREGDKENVHFLNMVDEADLLSLIEDGETVEIVCECKEKCADGKVNTECQMCKNNLAGCVAPEATTEKPAEETTEADGEGENEDETENKSKSGIIIFVIIALAAGGYAVYHFKFKGKGTNDNGGSSDTYTDPDDEEEYEVEEETATEEE